MVWHGMVCGPAYGMVWFGLWYGMDDMWNGMWYGMIWYGME